MNRISPFTARTALTIAATISLSAMLSSCALSKKWTEERKAEQAKKLAATAVQRPAIQMFDWKGERVSGPAKVKILLHEQKAYIYCGGQEAGWTYLASGTAGHSTPTGNYKVMEKIARKSSNTYGIIVNASGNVIDWDAKAGRESVPKGGRFVGAPMPYWMRITASGVGMHSGPIPNPGRPASHGCIRLPEEMAAKLFEVVDVGTPVSIVGTAPQS